MEQTKKTTSASSVAVIGLKLLLICAIVAGIVSFVYALTAEAYEKNLQATKEAAIGEIFGMTGLSYEELSAPEAAEVVYRVQNGETLVGYCVQVTSSGYGGDMELMVGFTEACAVLGVSVVSHAETPGLGSRATEAGFLDQFLGKSGQVELGKGLDAVSGATISSRGVTNGVNLATQALTEAMGGAQ